MWALLSAPVPDADNIGKFESLGTRSFAAEMAIGNAIDFQYLLGNKRKEDRLRYLKNCAKRKSTRLLERTCLFCGLLAILEELLLSLLLFRLKSHILIF